MRWVSVGPDSVGWTRQQAVAGHEASARICWETPAAREVLYLPTTAVLEDTMRRLATLFALLSLTTACSTNGSSNDDVRAPPTYYGEVGAILNQNCVSCHTAGGIGGFSLETYADAQPLSPLIKTYTAARIMPPFNADNSGECNTFKEARWLSDEQIATLGAWSDAGAPAGDSAIPVPTGTPAPTIVSPDAVVEMKADYLPVSGPNDDYRCFVVDPVSDVDVFVTAFEFVPGDSRVVHHAILYTMDSAGEASAVAQEGEDLEPGYDCFGGTKIASANWASAWVPGAGASILPSGTGVRLLGGRKMVMQIHYNTQQGSFPDRTSVKLSLAASVEKVAYIPKFGDTSMLLPPGEADVESASEFTLPDVGTIQLYAAAPHMHTLGRSFRAEYTKDSTTTCLVDVPRWDFGWQQLFFYQTPLTLPSGGTLKLSCHYNTSGLTEPVTYGENTDQEMCFALFYATAQ